MKRLALFVLLAAAFAAWLSPEAEGQMRIRIRVAAQTPPTNPITMSLSASRSSSCVAPCGVVFDASGTTATSVTYPFHDLQYTWDFGDTASGAAWTNGTRTASGSKNAASGPIAAHLFETAGTYKVVVSVTNGTDTNSTSTSVVVDDADTIFNGKTFCVANGSLPVAGVGNCPSGATGVNQSNFKTAIDNNIGTGNVRILFKCGDTFSQTVAVTVSAAKLSPGIIGAYPVGCANRPIIDHTGNADVIVPDADDWRFMDLEAALNSGTSARWAHPSTINSKQMTFLRIKAHDGHNGYTYSSGASFPAWDQIFIVENEIATIIGGSGGYGMFLQGGTRFAVLGNLINDTSAAEHNLRMSRGNKTVISSNTIKYPDGVNNKTNIKLHAQDWGTFGDYTEKTIISDNDLFQATSGAGGSGIELQPQSALVDERIRDVIIERNRFTPGSASYNRPFMSISAQDVTIRNNFSDLSANSSVGSSIVAVSQRGIEPAPTRVRIYHNSVYTAQAVAAKELITLANGGAAVTNSIVKNNLGYAPNVTGASKMVRDYASDVSNTISNNTSDTQLVSSNPSFTATPPTTLAHWKITGASYAIGTNNGCAGSPCATATAVPMWTDFFLVTQPAARDLGAVIH